MSQIEDAKGGWPPHDSISHIASHAPIQVQPENPQDSFHVMQQGTWQLPSAKFGNFVTKPPLFGSEWRAPGDWSANNNKLGEWDKWSASTGDVANPLASFGTTSLLTTTPAVKTANYERPKEDERKSSDHTNSYDVSASQSPSNNDEENSNSSDIQIDVECMAADDQSGNKKKKKESKTKTEVLVNSETKLVEETDSKKEEAEKKVEKDIKVEISTSHTEDTELLLNFSQQCTETKQNTQTSGSKNEPTKLTGFLHSGSSAFSNIEQVPRPSSTEMKAKTPPPTVVNTPGATSSSSFCRPPGLGPVSVPPPTNGQAAPLVCPICGFSCPSKFHYNSHMNTHGDHQCNMCDYTSRTEGRLKKHMRESHTVEEQLKAGLEIDSKTETSANNTAPLSMETEPVTGSSDGQVPTSSNTFMLNLSTTMASILDSTANALAASMTSTEASNPLPNSLNLDISTTPNLLSSLSSTALDQIRAFTENSGLISDCSINIASALGDVSQAFSGEPKTPEKQSSGEHRRGSSGKVKILKCKQCGHQSLSKNDQWAHARTHIPNEKQLSCSQCNFVTEYKHHLEYHFRNHIGSKPFQCKKCAYTCVNKSMLNSHMKSHTNHYQFRCMDCTYATKYCHSLKLHLKKYNHRRVPEGIEMNGGDCSPTLSSNETIPSYPTFNNLKIEKKFEPETPIAQSFNFPPIVNTQSLNYASQMLLKHHQMDSPSINPLISLQSLNNLPSSGAILKCPMCEVQCTTQDEQMRHNMSHFMNSSVPTTLASLYNNISSHISAIGNNGTSMSSANTNGTETSMEVDEINDEPEVDHEGSVIDGEEGIDHISDCPNSPTGSSKTSTGSCDEEHQKRKAFNKLEEISQRLQGKSPTCSDSIPDKDDECHIESSVSPVEQINEVSQAPTPVISIPETPLVINTSEPNSLNNLLQQACLAFNVIQTKREEGAFNFTCPHCRMAFHDQALYHIHMGYHGYEHAFKCNRCGYTANDSLNFNLHLLQSSHE